MASVVSEHQLPQDTPIVYLDANAAFDKLTADERLYAHYLSVASWAGQRIVLRQCSEESETIFDLILALFKGKNVDELKAKSIAAGNSTDNWSDFLQYLSMFLGKFI